MIKNSTLIWIILTAVLLTCEFSGIPRLAMQESHLLSEDPELGRGYDYRNNGKDKTAPILPYTYNPTPFDSLELPIITGDLVAGLEYQLKLLKIKKQKRIQKIGNLEFTMDQLETVIEQMLSWQYTKPLGLAETLVAHQIEGEDKRGNVHYTGYFIPVLKVRKKKNKRYKFPIYTRPKNWSGKYPTRAQIDGEGVLAGRGLELAYARNPVDIYFMQVQGSGYVEYANGERMLFAYDGTNRHPYRSVGKYLVTNDIIEAEYISMDGIKRLLQKNPKMIEEVLFINPSYTFFTPQKSSPRGAGLVPLSTDFSIAVDSKYIPLGSVLLGKVPIVDKKGRLLRHEFRFLLAQDRGGAIKGPGHVDLFSGSGPEGRDKASYLHHYGKLWLLLPRSEPPST